MTWKDLRHLNRDDILASVGLARKGNYDWIAPAIGFFTAGIALGAGIGLLLAPKPGRELRNELQQKLQASRQRLGAKVEQVESMM